MEKKEMKKGTVELFLELTNLNYTESFGHVFITDIDTIKIEFYLNYNIQLNFLGNIKEIVSRYNVKSAQFFIEKEQLKIRINV